jgi:hypothetical protein
MLLHALLHALPHAFLPVIPVDGFCPITPSYLANLLVEENFHSSFLLAVLW